MLNDECGTLSCILHLAGEGILYDKPFHLHIPTMSRNAHAINDGIPVIVSLGRTGGRGVNEGLEKLKKQEEP